MLTNAYERRIVDIQLLFPSDIFNNHLAFIGMCIEAPRRVVYRRLPMLSSNYWRGNNVERHTRVCSIINETSVIWRRK